MPCGGSASSSTPCPLPMPHSAGHDLTLGPLKCLEGTPAGYGARSSPGTRHAPPRSARKLQISYSLIDPDDGRPS